MAMTAMSDMLAALAATASGFALGGFFYGGLWWTVRHAVEFRRPALALVGSAVVRMGVALVGFYLTAGGEWSRMLLCLLGFLLARVAVTWATRLPSPPPSTAKPEQAGHAP
jgi:F1F0 ATPase subunit 2